MNLTIIGYGFVGKALDSMLEKAPFVLVLKLTLNIPMLGLTPFNQF
mgnify:CR=1 FL=1